MKFFYVIVKVKVNFCNPQFFSYSYYWVTEYITTDDLLSIFETVRLRPEIKFRII